jgi:tRNA (cytidine/uridine-2'-O-)-methyltransferase
MPTITSGRFAASRDEEEDLRTDENSAGGRVSEPNPLLQVVLYQPEIPQNTGNIARTCAATRTPLHLIEPLGFRLSDRYLKRAGLDYWPRVFLKVHANFEELRRALGPVRMVYLSAHALRPYYAFPFLPGDCLVFGSETTGLPREMLASEPERILKIPIDRSRVRSLNLATSVGIVLFEAVRQLGSTHQGSVVSCSFELGGSSDAE